MLVSLGSCLFTIISIDFYRIYGNFNGIGPVGVDPARIAAQVVTGIGFLGAGAIIRERGSIRGLTTAACLWVASAIGLSCGAGRYAPAVAVTGIAFVSLLLLKKVENLLKRDNYIVVKVLSDDLEGQIGRVELAMLNCQVEVISMALVKDLEDRTLLLDFQVRHHTRELASVLADRIVLIGGVKKVWVE